MISGGSVPYKLLAEINSDSKFGSVNIHEGIDPDIMRNRVFAQFNDKPDNIRLIKFVPSHIVVGISPVKQFKAAPNVVSL
jgi:hypothetical protein